MKIVMIFLCPSGFKMGKGPRDLPAARLKSLAELNKRGLITEEEFQSKRKSLLGEL